MALTGALIVSQTLSKWSIHASQGSKARNRIAMSSSSIEFVPTSEQSFFSEKSFFALSADKKKVLVTCIDGQAVISFDEGKNFSEILMPFNEAGLLTHKAALSNGNSFLVSFSDGSVNHYVYNEEFNVEHKLITKCPGPLTALTISPNGKIAICCGQNNEVKVIHIKGLNDYPIIAKLPVSHFIQAVEFNAEGTQFATVDCNGNTLVYTIEGDDLRPSDPIFLKTETTSKRSGYFGLSWSPRFLAVLSGSEKIQIFERSTWTPTQYHTMPEDIYSFSLISDKLAFMTSPTGISAWSLEAQRISLICRLTAENISEQINKFQIFEAGQMEFCAVSASKSLLLVHANETVYSVNAAISPQDLDIDSKKERSSATAKTKSIKAEKLEKLSKKQRNQFTSDEAEATDGEEEDDADEMDEGEDLDDEMEEDNDMMNFSENDAHNGETDADAVDDEEMSNVGEIDAVVRKRHTVIQPGRTPWRHLQRFLAYNSVGYVTARQDSENMSLFNYDIEFMDRGSYKPIRFSEEIEYDMATLNESGVIFANETSVHFIPLADRRQTWTIQMRPNSKPVLVALGSEHCYVVLQRRVINIYTIGGIFLRSVVCPSEPLSIIASNSELAFFGQDTQGITCNLLDPRTGAESCSSRVLVGTDAITWCGYNYAGVLAAFTSSGRMLIRLASGQWTEVLDLSSHADIQVAWPCYFDVMSMSVIKCTFEDAFPDPYPPKPMTEIPFCIPEAPDAATEEIVRTKLIVHETLLASSDALTEKERRKLDIAADRHLLELAQLAISAGRIGRVVELARLAAGEKTVDLMIQLAKHHKLIAVVDDLERIRFPQIAVSAASSAATLISSEPTLSGGATSAVQSSEPILLRETVVDDVPAPLTPIKCVPSVESVLAASSSVAGSSPLPAAAANPFLKTQTTPSAEQPQQSSVMLDYISNIMKMTTVKRKASANENDQSQNKRIH